MADPKPRQKLTEAMMRQQFQRDYGSDPLTPYAQPFAYAFDSTMNDIGGPNGILGDLGWERRIPRPDNFAGQVVGDVSRTIMGSGGMAVSPNLGAMTLGTGVAGLVKDPEDSFTSNRAGNAAIEGALGFGAGILGPMLGRSAYQFAQKARFPEAVNTLHDYMGSFTGAGRNHASGEIGEASRKVLPKFAGETTRGQMPDSFGKQVQNLKPGDTFAPGRAMSTSTEPQQSRLFARGGPMMTIRNKTARDGRWFNWREAEVITDPNATYKVVSVIRDKTGKVTHVELEEIGPDMGRARKALQDTLEYGAPASAIPSNEGLRNNVREGRKR